MLCNCKIYHRYSNHFFFLSSLLIKAKNGGGIFAQGISVTLEFGCLVVGNQALMFDKLPEYGHRIDNNTKHIAVLDEDGGVHTMFGMGGGIFLEQANHAGFLGIGKFTLL